MRRFLRIVKSNINPVILFSGVLKSYNLLAPISVENCSKTTQFVAFPLITSIIISVIYKIYNLRNQINKAHFLFPPQHHLRGEIEPNQGCLIEINFSAWFPISIPVSRAAATSLCVYPLVLPTEPYN